jgi:hypothetical protein
MTPLLKALVLADRLLMGFHLVAPVAYAQSPNYFGDSNSDDGIYAGNGKWWFYDMGDARREGSGWLYGGIYRQI